MSESPRHAVDLAARLGDLLPRHDPRPQPPELCPSGRQKCPAGLGQGDPAVVSHKEGLSELPFESLDRGAQTGLHNVDPRGGAGEVLLLGHRDEVLELAELHVSILSMMSSKNLLDQSLAEVESEVQQRSGTSPIEQ